MTWRFWGYEMLNLIDELEQQRQSLQSQLDASKNQLERNRLGQFATPTSLAQDILHEAKKLLPEGQSIRFLDPAFGTGAFFSALLNSFSATQISETVGYEIDPHYGKPAGDFWSRSNLDLRIADFTLAKPSARFNLVVCNPPYVRHHHLEREYKKRLQFQTYSASGMKMSGLAGLYCHFIGLAHAWMADDGIAGWLIPSEFMDVNYGKAVKNYLLTKVTLLHIHRFDPTEMQFSDALVSSAVVWFKYSKPPPRHTIRFTFGGTLTNPKCSREIPAEVLSQEPKWTRFPIFDVSRPSNSVTLSNFFQIKRGLVTGDNSFFILNAQEIAANQLPKEVFRPILPSSRYLPDNEISADENGWPLLENQLFLLDTRLPEDEIKNRYPLLYSYLQKGKEKGLPDRYICSHRTPWYAQEIRPAAPIVCTYIGRNDSVHKKPFRFILNNSLATAANVYLAMYPKPRLAQAIKNDPALLRQIWEILNDIDAGQLLGKGRVYGGGLHKLEPGELARVDATPIAQLLSEAALPTAPNQLELFGNLPANMNSR